jgi:hypothetical protein
MKECRELHSWKLSKCKKYVDKLKIKYSSFNGLY